MRNIDAVITWVDGDDPVLRAKRMKYGSKDLFVSNDVAGETRFNNLGEIFWCVASLNRFAPWLHKIYLVTDGQDPHLEEFLQKCFPGGFIPMEIIDHQTIFRGYEQYLPTFNSITLETMTWRIPGLSDYYLELNDDFMLAAPLAPEDFITPEGKVVCYATRYNLFWTRITRRIKPRINGRKQVTFKGAMMNAADLAGQKYTFFKLNHTPRCLSRRFFETYYREHPEHLLRNIQYRFRDAAQYTPEELQYLLLYREKKCRLAPVKGNLFFLQPKPRPDYVQHKLRKLEAGKRYRFCCFNSIDLASEPDRKEILKWIENRLDISLRS